MTRPWNIKRTDTRRRCGKCYRPLGAREIDFYCAELVGTRFPRVGECHKQFGSVRKYNNVYI